MKHIKIYNYLQFLDQDYLQRVIKTPSLIGEFIKSKIVV